MLVLAEYWGNSVRKTAVLSHLSQMRDDSREEFSRTEDRKVEFCPQYFRSGTFTPAAIVQEAKPFQVVFSFDGY